MPDAPATIAAPPQRELEQAPLLLRKASKVLIAGALLPWITIVSTQGHMPWGYWAGGVALTLLAGFILLETVKTRRGLPANGAVQGLAKAHPLAGTGLALVVFIGACVVAWLGTSWFHKDTGAFLGQPSVVAVDRFDWRALLELATLLLGLATFAHILDYEHGGKFNPLFPLMFAGPAIAGALQVFGAFGAFKTSALAAVVSLAGSVTVAAGGCMAIYTMYASMKQAKIDGDLKRAAQRESRKTDRAASRAAGDDASAARKPR